MFDVDVWFGVSILIYDDFKSILICLTAWKIFGVMIKNSFCTFDGCGQVEKFYRSEDDDMFLCNIHRSFFGNSGKFQSDGGGLTIINYFDCFYMSYSVVIYITWVGHGWKSGRSVFWDLLIVERFLGVRGGDIGGHNLSGRLRM